MKKLLILLIAAAMLLAGCKQETANSPATADTAATEKVKTKKLNEPVVPTEAPTEAPKPTEPSFEELVQKKYESILSGKAEKKQFAMNEVYALNQLDGMEAGCEALALTAALTHFGYELDMDEIVDKYLVYSDDYVFGYCGDPHYFGDGSGIFPPGMVTTIQNFVKDKKAAIYPFDTTGMSMDDLYKFVEKGCPVLIWTTYNRSYPSIEFSDTYNGIEYPWYPEEHCVCLCGFDKDAHTVQIADSWGGHVDWEDAENFEDVYDEIGRFSVVLMGTEDLK